MKTDVENIFEVQFAAIIGDVYCITRLGYLVMMASKSTSIVCYSR